MKIAIFTTGFGSLVKSIIDAVGDGTIRNSSMGLIVDSGKSWGLQVAFGGSMPVVFLPSNLYDDVNELDSVMLKLLDENGIDFIVLSNYVKILPPKVVEKYSGRALNVHPSLLPKYGGKGMYGEKVLQATLDSGDRETGVTVHYVSEEYDAGEIVDQLPIPIYPHDTLETLNGKLVEAGKSFYPIMIDKVINGRY